MSMVPTPPGECLAWRDLELALGYEILYDVEVY